MPSLLRSTIFRRHQTASIIGRDEYLTLRGNDLSSSVNKVLLAPQLNMSSLPDEDTHTSTE
eukprot:3968899-Amphidinium_carterae.1